MVYLYGVGDNDRVFVLLCLVFVLYIVPFERFLISEINYVIFMLSLDIVSMQSFVAFLLCYICIYIFN